jgi:hypothetical protein
MAWELVYKNTQAVEYQPMSLGLNDSGKKKKDHYNGNTEADRPKARETRAHREV